MIKLNPSIAVLIPAYNEEIVIKGTIDALLEAGMPRSDIYVVNDRSTDKTEEIASSTGVNVYTVPVNGGKANAQRAALSYFRLSNRYKWIIFLDGDTKVDVNFLKEMRNAAIENPEMGVFVGQVKSVKNNHIYSAGRAYEYTYGQDIAKQGQSNFGVVFVSPGCASMYNGEFLAKSEIDADTLAEDMDLTLQAHRFGYKVRYIPNAFVNTQDPSTLKDYNKQILRWYRGLWQVIKKHGVYSPKNNSRVDWYMRLVTIDALFFNPAFWTIFLLFTTSVYVAGIAFLGNIAISFLIACYVSIRARRLDTITRFPLYHWLSYVNFYAYTRAFVEIIIQRKTLLAWNKVKRYNFDSHTK